MTAMISAFWGKSLQGSRVRDTATQTRTKQGGFVSVLGKPRSSGEELPKDFQSLAWNSNLFTETKLGSEH